MPEVSPNDVSRRNFIKGVIATGAAVSSATYLFRINASWGSPRRLAAWNGWSR